VPAAEKLLAFSYLSQKTKKFDATQNKNQHPQPLSQQQNTPRQAATCDAATDAAWGKRSLGQTIRR
jgi:hypothetical protein